VPFTVVLLSTLALIYGSIVAGGFRLTKPLGAFFFCLYFVFVAGSLLKEFGRLPEGWG